jgi:hypothetical protein
MDVGRQFDKWLCELRSAFAFADRLPPTIAACCTRLLWPYGTLKACGKVALENGLCLHSCRSRLGNVTHRWSNDITERPADHMACVAAARQGRYGSSMHSPMFEERRIDSSALPGKQRRAQLAVCSVERTERNCRHGSTGHSNRAANDARGPRKASAWRSVRQHYGQLLSLRTSGDLSRATRAKQALAEEGGKRCRVILTAHSIHRSRHAARTTAHHPLSIWRRCGTEGNPARRWTARPSRSTSSHGKTGRSSGTLSGTAAAHQIHKKY